MTLAPTLQKHLDQNVTYEVITHDPTMSSTRTAEACRISGNCLAKGVVLKHDGGYVLAVLPASRHLHLTDLRDALGENAHGYHPPAYGTGGEVFGPPPSGPPPSSGTAPGHDDEDPGRRRPPPTPPKSDAPRFGG